MRIKVLFITLASTALVLAAMSFTTHMERKIKLSGTKWKSVQELFISDVGTSTITTTIEFVNKKDVVITTEHFIPAHPNMQMNSDGTVSVNPASSSSSTVKGTYTVKKDEIIIKVENKTYQTLIYIKPLNILGGSEGRFERVE